MRPGATRCNIHGMDLGMMAVRRMLRSGAKDFVRGGAVSAATVLIMTVTLAIIATLVFLSALLTFTLDAIKEKVDVSVYFVTSAAEEEIFAVKEKLEQLPQVASITYTSADEALAAFRERHATDELTLQALEEVGGNPLDASLKIRAKDPSQYESIVAFLEATPALSASGASVIDRINYAQNKQVIDRLGTAIEATREIGLTIVLFFALASVLIAFATIRLAIYSSREEIAVMRLMGASNTYIQGPFVVAGVITGVIAAVIVLLLAWPATWYAGAKTASWLGGWDIAEYYVSHLWLFALVLVGAGAVLGALASALAARRYLKV